VRDRDVAKTVMLEWKRSLLKGCGFSVCVLSVSFVWVVCIGISYVFLSVRERESFLRLDT